MTTRDIPVIDVASLLARARGRAGVGAEIGRACREHGFFYTVGHGVPAALQQSLEALARQFFAQDLERKLAIRMEHGGRAWRGYFPVGAEKTSGLADVKEGLYFGAEHAPDHPLVRARTPLFGTNLFPDVSGLRERVLEYMDAMTALGHALMEGIAIGLGLHPDYFADHGTRDPLTLFRIFHYPPLGEGQWSVGEHTDYGMLTILAQDASGGLQVESRGEWIDAPPIDGAFLCNIGDMLERTSGGRLLSTPHRVRNPRSTGRLSFPFFFDPSFDARIEPIGAVSDDAHERWDGKSVHAFEGTYGEYVVSKVRQVFPDLALKVL